MIPFPFLDCILYSSFCMYQFLHASTKLFAMTSYIHQEFFRRKNQSKVLVIHRVQILRPMGIADFQSCWFFRLTLNGMFGDTIHINSGTGENLFGRPTEIFSQSESNNSRKFCSQRCVDAIGSVGHDPMGEVFKHG